MDRTTELLAEAERISRPALELRLGGDGPVAARWIGGDLHCVTIDLAALAGLGLFPERPPEGSLDVLREGAPPALHPSPLSDRLLRGDRLRATPVRSFPPLEAICQYGGPIVDGWLGDLGLTRADADHARTIDSREGKALLGAWQARCPLYSASVEVVLGGWHMQWPEDDAYEIGSRRLVAWTFRNSEPWLEVWLDEGTGRFTTVERIT